MNTREEGRLVAIIGASGTVGEPVLEQLKGRARVRLILRNPPAHQLPDGVTAVMTDMSSTDLLARAMSGVDALFVGIGTSPELARIERRIIDAAVRARVGRIVRISAPDIPSVAVSRWHGEVELSLAESGLPHVNIRPAAFMQNWLRNATPIRLTGRITGSAGNGSRNYVDARDVAACAVRSILADSLPVEQTVLTVTGPDAVSHPEMAEKLTFVTGRTVHYMDISEEEHLQLLMKHAKLPDWLAHHVTELDTLARTSPESGTDFIRDFLGRAPRTMDEFVTEHREAFMRPWLLRLASYVKTDRLQLWRERLF